MKNIKISELITTIYLAAVLVGLPLVFFHGYLDISLVKYYFFCGISILLLPALFFGIKDGFFTKNFLKSLSLAEKALLIYWLISALSTLLSPYSFESFWGNEGRLSGFFTMSIYVIAYFVISRCYKPYPAVINGCLAAACLVFLLAVTDYFNMDILHFKSQISADYRPIFISTIGNINFYTSYGSIILGFITALFAAARKKHCCVIYFFLMLLTDIGLIIGNSDSAYLAIAILLAFLPLYLFQSYRGIAKYFIIISALLLSFFIMRLCNLYFYDIVMEPEGIAALIMKMDIFPFISIGFWIVTVIVYCISSKVPASSSKPLKKIQRIWMIFLLLSFAVILTILVDANILGNAQRYGSYSNYLVFDDDWGTNRGFIWKNAVINYNHLPILQKIFGHGPDTYGILSYYNNLKESVSIYGQFFDSVHNEYLQFFVTIGPIATAAYLFFILQSIRDMICRGSNPYAIAAAFAVFCYSGQAIVNINQPSSTPIFWMILAMGIAEINRSATSSSEAAE